MSATRSWTRRVSFSEACWLDRPGAFASVFHSTSTSCGPVLARGFTSAVVLFEVQPAITKSAPLQLILLCKPEGSFGYQTITAAFQHSYVMTRPVICRHARRCARHLQGNSAREAGHDVLGYALQGDPPHLQEVHERRTYHSQPQHTHSGHVIAAWLHPPTMQPGSH